MKKGIILLILILLIIPTILAAEELSALSGGLDDKTEDVLEREVQIPEEFEFIYILFQGIGEGAKSINWQELITFIVITIFIFVFFMEILELTAFETNWVKFAIAGTITILSLISGFVHWIIMWLYKIIDNFWLLAGIILAALLILFFARSFLDIIKKQKKMSKAEEIGIKSGITLKGLSKMSEAAISAANNK